MCGIVGIWRRGGYDPEDSRRLAAMTAALAHRGPDDFGFAYLDTQTGRADLTQSESAGFPCDLLLGNRRLTIVDLSPNGRQPMSNEAGDVFAVFNGEVYNHIELRRELEGKGHSFRSRSDTEVVVHAYEEWGENCAKRFVGMWAYAIWDQRSRRLVCSRDRFGIKPFYYTGRDGTFIFASEIKGILPALRSSASPDRVSIAAYLARGGMSQDERTFFEGIRRLAPAHNLVMTEDGHSERRYWSYADASAKYDYTRPVETFRQLFSDSIELTLRSDVPVGILLSGGVDSSSIAAFASGRSGANGADAFSAVFPGEPMDEGRHARLVAEKLGMRLHQVDFDAATLAGDLVSVIRHMDAPPISGSVLPRWRLLKMAGCHVKVVLEGQGADEMLAGYVDRYFTPYALDELGSIRVGNFPGVIGRMAAAWWMARTARPVRRRSFSDSAGWQTLSPDLLAILREARGPSPLGSPFPDRLTNKLYHDHARRALPHLLNFGDALSMAHSVESRVPYLDHRLVEFVFSLPFRAKYDGPVSKPILREAVKDRVPREILARRDKVGFDVPLWTWLRPHLRTAARPLLESRQAARRGLYDRKRLLEALRRCENGDEGLVANVFRWLSLELWFRNYIDGDGGGEFGAASGAQSITT